MPDSPAAAHVHEFTVPIEEHTGILHTSGAFAEQSNGPTTRVTLLRCATCPAVTRVDFNVTA